MAVDTFIPEVWSAALLAALSKSLVYGTVANREYEGTISRAGDTVHINTISDPTIATYTKNSTAIDPETLTTADQTLLINQSKYFAFEVDDVDARQVENGGALLAAASERAGYGLADTADQYIAGLYTGVDAGNDLGIVSVTSADLAYTQLVNLRTKLDEANVPYQARWVVVPPWFEALLLDNAKFVQYTAAANDRLENGRVGRAAGFEVHKSNNVPNPAGDDHVVIAGYPGALTYAEQINSVEAYRPDSSFSDAIKGLHLYGSKLVRDTGIATVTASIT